MNPARTLGPGVVSATSPSLWVYLSGPGSPARRCLSPQPPPDAGS
ncbi:hypothetical protein GBA65_10470 [Rubrobacter marinus]|uniref:Uncharacterized protein n=1 Tax=Rubrobacter marinus TaxID=2653852 RepID=A0A6G8PXC5_9ACTN|nr:hypothetical protein GBA65_10470 [Rubrobacter marinus]